MCGWFYFFVFFLHVLGILLTYSQLGPSLSPPFLLVAVSVPKRRRKIKELNKKEAVGDLLDAFKEVREQVVEGKWHSWEW